MKRQAVRFYLIPLFVSCFLLIAGSASCTQEQQDEYNLYLYRPLKVGDSWTYRTNGLEGTQMSTVKVTGEDTLNSRKVKVFEQASGWVDFYEETEAGLERPKDINKKDNAYGIYEPAAIQYPKKIKMGETYSRVSLRKDFKLQDNALIEQNKEKLELTLAGKENVKIAYGDFKDCLKLLADSQLINDKGEILVRKLLLTWNAENVGVVKVIFMRFDSGTLTRFEEGELVSAVLK